MANPIDDNLILPALTLRFVLPVVVG
jgi:hypothetical protein